MEIDINCDMGEGFANDSALMDYVSSVNMACGYHAGDPATMQKPGEYAIEKCIAIGAHPSYPDREGFGRRPLILPLDEVYDVVVEQLEALSEICRSLGTRLRHVKPHGYLYNQSARERNIAGVIAEAILHFDQTLVLVGLSGSYSISEARSLGLRTASEAFADRTYRYDGSLTPRTEPNAVITDATAAAEQAFQIVDQGKVEATNGELIRVEADTICIHGDGENALEFAAAIHAKLVENEIKIEALDG